MLENQSKNKVNNYKKNYLFIFKILKMKLIFFLKI